MLEKIIPFQCFTREGPIQVDHWEITLEETAFAQGFGARRKAEFFTGRSYARQALKKANQILPSLLPNSDRSPNWPLGIVGSISHTRDYCGVVLADQNHFRGLGLDIEVIGRITPEISSKVFLDKEWDLLTSGSPSQRREGMAAIFSAKESFYKMQFPLTKGWVGFQDVSVRLEPEGRFLLSLEKDLNKEFLQGRAFAGNYTVFDSKVATLMVI